MTILEKVGNLTDFEKAILNTARTVFEKKGYYETNIEEIALSLSIGKGTIYRHFGNKYMLFYSVVLDILEDTKNFLDKINTIDTFENKLDFFIEQMVKMTLIFGNFIRIFLEEHLYLMKDAYNDKKMKEPYEYFLKTREIFFHSLSDIIRQGKKDGKIMEEVEPMLSAQLIINTIFYYFKNPSAIKLNKKNFFNHRRTKIETAELKQYIYRALGYNGKRSIQ